ncbi:MAG TPA: SDR family NAD(P)-dependent oxidoreductase [Solirubrobacteraceae bacterium]|jgi:NAD(P)-dependent dehydrogenase (short-subunit alcohol dehydrogenase family)|nr:SDR family NAD(P)-dependent oxidoreductase [Solirubrobacteraceae bacterium]
MRIEGSGALVVGGASGLGAATARALHARGAIVVVADVDAERGAALAAELGERASFAAADVTQPEQLEEAVAHAAAVPGGLRISVHCAGIVHAERTARDRGPHRTETFERVIAINLVGTFHALRLASAAMLAGPPGPASERGVIVNTASIAAFDGQIGQIAYAASKGGVVALTLPAARDLATFGIRVCAIAPGLFDTPLLAGLPADARQQLAASIPYPPRLGDPAEFAQLVCQIVDNDMLNGEVIRLDGALRMAPR